MPLYSIPPLPYSFPPTHFPLPIYTITNIYTNNKDRHLYIYTHSPSSSYTHVLYKYTFIQNVIYIYIPFIHHIYIMINNPL